MGPFLGRISKIHGRSSAARAQGALWMAELRRYMGDEGVGQIRKSSTGRPAPRRRLHRTGLGVAELLRTATLTFFTS